MFTVQYAEGGSEGVEETDHGLDTKGEGDPGNESETESADNEDDGNVQELLDSDTYVNTEEEDGDLYLYLYEGEVDSNVDLIELADMQNVVPYWCVWHIHIKKAYTYYDRLLIKVRRIAGKIKNSSVAVSKLKKETGKVLLSDNNIRWNSTWLIDSFRWKMLTLCL